MSLRNGLVLWYSSSGISCSLCFELAKTLSCRYSRNWSFIAFAQEDYQSAPSQGWGSHGCKVSLFLPSTSEAHFSCHLIWKHVSNPTRLWMHNDPGLYCILSSWTPPQIVISAIRDAISIRSIALVGGRNVALFLTLTHHMSLYLKFR